MLRAPGDRSVRAGAAPRLSRRARAVRVPRGCGPIRWPPGSGRSTGRSTPPTVPGATTPPSTPCSIRSPAPPTTACCGWRWPALREATGRARPGTAVRLAAVLGVESAVTNLAVKTVFGRLRPVIDPSARRLRRLAALGAAPAGDQRLPVGPRQRRVHHGRVPLPWRPRPAVVRAGRAGRVQPDLRPAPPHVRRRGRRRSRPGLRRRRPPLRPTGGAGGRGAITPGNAGETGDGCAG